MPPYLEAEKERLAQIRSRGHWELVVRPDSFKERVTTTRGLFGIVEKSSLDLGGWRFPFVPDRPGELVNGRRHVDTRWVGQLHRWEHHLEAWRVYTSGQLALATSVAWDWRDESESWPVNGKYETWARNTKIGIGHIVRMLLQIFVFCSKLSETPAGDESLHVGILLAPTEGRALFSDLPRRVLVPVYKADVDRVVLNCHVSRLDLLSKVDDLTAEAAHRVFEDFGFKPNPSIVRELIAEVRG